ncbi:hypothetical protein GCM10008985_09100 [Halococcus dombrowskii]|uniref:PemK-like protein n=1 Tax=Halococcus dombrowskii TaxID=179637 RepID=A0AAV3SET7_HALDO
MTAFEELERGDIVWATDPLSEKGRPMLVLGTLRFPNHGVQLIIALISTKTFDLLHAVNDVESDHRISGAVAAPVSFKTHPSHRSFAPSPQRPEAC